MLRVVFFLFSLTSMLFGCASQTYYSAGDGDLKLYVSKTKDSTIKIDSFKKNNYVIDEIINLDSLNCHASKVLLAEPSRGGTFAVLYGKSSDRRFVAFGFKNEKELIKVSNDPRQASNQNIGIVDTTPEYDIDLKWITTRVLKINHGHHGQDILILRFQPGAGTWEKLDGKGSEIKVSPPDTE